MCGIVGYVNYKLNRSRKYVITTLLDGLARLDYRGYDSTGLLVDGDETDKVLPYKIIGKVAALKQLINDEDVDLKKVYTTHAGIAHTRWAANGVATLQNCHPLRSDVSWRFAIVHNGIVTNYKKLRTQLASEPYQWEGETDTEVAVKLAMHLYDQNAGIGFAELACTLANKLEGAFSLLLKSVHYPGELIAIKKGSPLVIGITSQDTQQMSSLPVSYHPQRFVQNGEAIINSANSTHSVNGTSVSEPSPMWAHEYFFASDPSAIAEHTKRMVFMEDCDIAHVHYGLLDIYSIGSPDEAGYGRPVQTFDHLDGSIPSKGTYAHYMQKEIYEQPEIIEAALKDRLDVESGKIDFQGLGQHMDRIRTCSKISFIACGSSYYACLAMQELFETLTNVTVSIDIASSFLDKLSHISADVAYVFVSQSGETAECLTALQYCQKRGGFTIGIVNVVDSSIARLTHCGLYINAGVEIGVATTKAYTSQLVHLVLLALALGAGNDSTHDRRREITKGLQRLPEQMRRILTLDSSIKELCETKLMHKANMLVLGRGYQYATALEASLKIKEVAYIHCEAVLTGELKHGVLALVDDNFSVVMIATRDRSFERSLNGYEQLLSHGGDPIILCQEGETAFNISNGHCIEVLETVDCLQSVLNIIPLQLMSYWLGVLRNNSVDFPRHVAKSVTVE
ncbi:glutamine--fructose-6-phosphate transaminase (isomerizing) [Didymosphaeria variabile]|uniref:glutamine--fructose-6-phosphate transaminase (isomerizing) n=1 Tax=Didymosphaeria variabile TaxID=1932322 RepID=A0A9W9CB97_9PLEO|nr:glutamine--fructose-6-phosphate transaminase (isomerizing) [Didymosphaeria variabile]KAJ4354546.1 glutamine--fructose-6-phosphate transaminase (isomerizing) [Didymosphaeria variabile]